SVTLQEAEEDAPLVYNPIETGEITFRITEYKGDAWYVTDDLREDGTNIDRLMAERAAESTRALQETFETDFLAVAGEYYEANPGPHLINGFPHLIVSDGTNGAFELDALIRMRLVFDKANVPSTGRVFIADPIVEATVNALVTISNDVIPFCQTILENVMASGHRFMMSLISSNIITTYRLPVGTHNDDSTTILDGEANIFMRILDGQTNPILSASRRMPK